MRGLLPALLLLGGLLSGCADDSDPVTQDIPAVPPETLVQDDQPIQFGSLVIPSSCLPVGVCIVGGSPAVRRFEQRVDNETRVTGIDLTVEPDLGTDPTSTFRITATCMASEDGWGCLRDTEIVQKEGKLPLHLENSGFVLYGGARMVYTIEWLPVAPGVGVPHSYTGTGTLSAVRAA